jgi:hypothetical protein
MYNIHAHISFSDWSIVKKGVPKGSILEPLLFLTHINDLPQRKNSLSEPILFADDTSVKIPSKNFKNSVQWQD